MSACVRARWCLVTRECIVVICLPIRLLKPAPTAGGSITPPGGKCKASNIPTFDIAKTQIETKGYGLHSTGFGIVNWGSSGVATRGGGGERSAHVNPILPSPFLWGRGGIHFWLGGGERQQTPRVVKALATQLGLQSPLFLRKYSTGNILQAINILPANFYRQYFTGNVLHVIYYIRYSTGNVQQAIVYFLYILYGIFYRQYSMGYFLRAISTGNSRWKWIITFQLWCEIFQICAH